MSTDAPPSQPATVTEEGAAVQKLSTHSEAGGQSIDPQQQLLHQQQQQQQRLLLQQQQQQQEQLRYAYAVHQQQQQQLSQRGGQPSGGAPPGALPLGYNQLYVQGVPAMPAAASYGQPSPGRYAAAVAVASGGAAPPHLYIPPHLISPYHHPIQQQALAAYQQQQAAAAAAADATSKAPPQSTVAGAQPAPQQQMLKSGRPLGTPQPFNAPNESVVSGQPAPSPSAASSVHDETSMDGSKFHSPGPGFQPPTPSGGRTQTVSSTPTSSSGQPSTSATVGDRASFAESVEKLVATCGSNISPHILLQRRVFFERLVQMLAEKGEMLSSPPQVSKSIVDLYALYEAVRRRGGFEQVTRDKCWKQLCPEANPTMQESSAAGYQLRKHYQRYLLALECRETGRNAEELVEFAERQKKKKKEKDAPTHQSPIRTPDAAARYTPGVATAAGGSTTPRQAQTPAAAAGGAFHSPATGQSGMTAEGAHPTGPSADYNPAAGPAGSAGPYYAAFAGQHPQHAAAAAAAAWAAQHGYPPGAAAAATAGAYNPAMRAVMPPGMRPMGELTEEQQRQQQQYFHQQQVAYAAHFQQQQLLAAQQQQLQQQQQQQQESSSLQIPPADSARGAASTPSARAGGTSDNRAPSTGAPDGRPPSQRPPSAAPRHTPTPGGYPYAASANAPTPPLTISTQSTAQQTQSQQQATPQPHPRATPQPTPQPQPAAASSAATSSSSISVSTAASAVPGPYFVPGSAPSPYAMRQLPPGVRPPAGMIMYGGPSAPAPGSGEMPPGVYPPGMYPQQPMWGLPGGVHPSARYGADYPAAFHQQQQLRNQQMQQQQQYAAAEAQRRAAAGFYAPPLGSVAAPPSGAAAVNAAAQPGVPPTAGSHSPGSVQRARIAALSQQQHQQTPSGYTHAQQQQMAARAAAVAAAGVLQTGYSVHHVAAAAHAAQINAAAAAAQMAVAAQMAPSTSGLNFPTGCIEALTANSAVMKRRRPKILTRDLTHATSKRLLMALRSGQHIETSWAINALNVILYDDTQPALSLVGAPELLNVIVEHFIAALAVLFPKHFKTVRSDWLLGLADECADGARHRAEGFDYILNDELTTATVNSGTSASSGVVPKPRKGSAASKKIAVTRPEEDMFFEPLVTVVADSKASVPAVVRPPMGGRSGPKSTGSGANANYTRVSRTGRRVYEREAQLPANLAKLLPAGVRIDGKVVNDVAAAKKEIREIGNTNESNVHQSGGYLAGRLQNALLVWTEAERAIASHRPKFSAALKMDKPLAFWEPETFDLLFPDRTEKSSGKKIETETIDVIKQEEITPTFSDENNFFRRAGKAKCARDNVPVNCALVMRPPMLQDMDPLMQKVADRCLALSNILRGLSFQPGQERALCQHVGLLRLIAVQLRLLADENDFVENNKSETAESGTEKSEPDELKLEASSRAAVRNEPSWIVAARRLLIETANHLRDDAFTILAHISVQLDLFDVDGEVSWMIFDALLNWAVSNSIQTRDPMLPGVLSPKSYTLEILCKMSVIERNVDLLLSTGTWPRLAEFVRVLCGLINLEEELPYREFAIVILNAICAASESACYVAAMETPVLSNLVSFLELADSKMHQIVQQQGMPALRENPELMGTSVGMLRRATLIMLHIARLEQCRKKFSKLQCRLLTFTTSHFMDSRVAAMVADILFEMQRSENNTVELKFSPTNDVSPTPAAVKKNEETTVNPSESEGQPKETPQTNGKTEEDNLFKNPTALKHQSLARHTYANGCDALDGGLNSRKRPLSPKSRNENDVHLSTKKIASELVMEKLRSNIIHKYSDEQNATAGGDSPLKKVKLLNGSIHKFPATNNHEDNNHEPAKLNGQRANNNNGKPASNNNNNRTDDAAEKSLGETEAGASVGPPPSATATTAAAPTTPSSQSGSMTAVA